MERDIKREPGSDLQGGEGVKVKSETIHNQSVPGGQTDNETKQQIHALAQASAAAHDTAVEQIDLVRRQQGEIAAKTSEYLRQQYDQQLDLQQQQEDFRKQMEEHRHHLQEQFRLLKAAEDAMVRQERQLEDLTEAVRPHIEARCGLFAEQSASAPATDQGARQTQESSVMLATGANIPVPPLYRGSTKKEKREFMDSYMAYKRRVDALHQGTQTRVFMMPLGACIEQRTLIRVCRFELFKNASEVTENDWKAYFLEARKPDVTAYKKLRLTVKSLAMDVELYDASSRLSRLLATFYQILDDLNMENIIHEDPKTVVEYLTNALRPQAFKATIKDYLSRPTYKPVKRDVQIFLEWLKPQLDEFMKYEVHIQATTTTQSNAPKAPVVPHDGGLSKAVANANKSVSGKSKHASTDAEVIPPTAKQGRQSKTNMNPTLRTCFNCHDPTHCVFQCPNVENVQEAKVLYEQHTGRKVVRDVPVGAIGITTVEDVNAKHHPNPARVNNIVDAMVTLDSGAGVTLTSPSLLSGAQSVKRIVGETQAG